MTSQKCPHTTVHNSTSSKTLIKNTPVNPINMSLKSWCSYLVENLVTKEVVEPDNLMIPKLCRVEQLLPENDWQLSFHLSRLKGLSVQIKSFNFKLLHQILPFKERLSHILRNTNPLCTMCTSQEPETLMHCFFQCDKNKQAGEALLELTRVYDKNITKERALLLNINTDPLYELPSTLTLCTGLEFIWRSRQDKKAATLYKTRAEIECLISLLRRSRIRALKEAGDMVLNTITNFPM